MEPITQKDILIMARKLVELAIYHDCIETLPIQLNDKGAIDIAERAIELNAIAERSKYVKTQPI